MSSPGDGSIHVTWQDRVRFPEATALFNPALGTVVLASAVAGYRQETGSDLPWLGAFLVTPFALHEETRMSLPPSIRTSLAVWASTHPVLRDGFGHRFAMLTPVTRRAIRFSLRSGVMTMAETRLRVVHAPRPVGSNASAELAACARAGRLCGRWLGRTDLPTAYSMLGVRP
jgi:hypothetical protein